MLRILTTFPNILLHKQDRDQQFIFVIYLNHRGRIASVLQPWELTPQEGEKNMFLRPWSWYFIIITVYLIVSKPSFVITNTNTPDDWRPCLVGRGTGDSEFTELRHFCVIQEINLYHLSYTPPPHLSITSLFCLIGNLDYTHERLNKNW